jgi:hypothetical protein
MAKRHKRGDPVLTEHEQEVAAILTNAPQDVCVTESCVRTVARVFANADVNIDLLSFGDIVFAHDILMGH